IEGVSFPSLNRVSLSILEYGSFGLGSLGVPSTRAQRPTVLSQPTIIITCSTAPCRTMDSRIRTPAPTVTPIPMDTLGPSCKKEGQGSTLAVGWMYTFPERSTQTQISSP
uniref:Uncharacterized protein n=1 Tax=Xenopus tropicalis TaxID=8364 RepID=A0A6I8S9J6_XENTR